jgi:hypothetical protein
MMRWLVLSVVVVALTAIATLVANFIPSRSSDGAFRVSTGQGAAPRVEVDGSPIHNFGTMSQKTTGKHSWTVHNKGTADLELWMQSSTCQCTIAKFADGKRAVVKPGEATKIDLEWETRDSIGDFSKGATIGTNDPARPSFPLEIKGNVHQAIVVIPNDRIVPMALVSSEEPKTMHVAFFAPEQPKLKILKIATSKPDLIVVNPKPLSETELKPLNVEGGYRLEVEVKPGMPIGSFLDEVVIQTDSELEPEVRLRVTGNVTGPISVVPERLRLINVTTSRGGSGEVTLLVRGGKSTRFEVASKPEQLSVEVAPSETATLKGRYRMTVTVPPGTPSGQISDTITLKTDNPKAAELKIPVNILVLGGAAG